MSPQLSRAAALGELSPPLSPVTALIPGWSSPWVYRVRVFWVSPPPPHSLSWWFEQVSTISPRDSVALNLLFSLKESQWLPFPPRSPNSVNSAGQSQVEIWPLGEDVFPATLAGPVGRTAGWV